MGCCGFWKFYAPLRYNNSQFQIRFPVWSAGAECEGETRNPPQKDRDAVSAGSSTVSGHQTEVPGMHEQGPPPGRQRLLRWDVVLMSPVLFHQLLQKWMYLPKAPMDFFEDEMRGYIGSCGHVASAAKNDKTFWFKRRRRILLPFAVLLELCFLMILSALSRLIQVVFGGPWMMSGMKMIGNNDINMMLTVMVVHLLVHMTTMMTGMMNHGKSHTLMRGMRKPFPMTKQLCRRKSTPQSICLSQ